MTTNLEITIHNLETGLIETRPMNEEEVIKYNEIQSSLKAKEEEENQKVQAKAQVLAQLGITEEQAKLLLS